MKKVILFIFAVLVYGTATAQKLPYQNSSLSPHERALDLVGRLTLEEKAKLMLDESEAIPRLGIKKFNWWSEALHGVANQGDVTVFPEPIGMAASFNDDLLYKIFTATSDEMRAKYNDRVKRGIEDARFHSLSVWTPNVNIFRDPRWGRGQETYGEDPYLTSRMGCAVVRGLQGQAPLTPPERGETKSTQSPSPLGGAGVGLTLSSTPAQNITQYTAVRSGHAIPTISPMSLHATFGKHICQRSRHSSRKPTCAR